MSRAFSIGDALLKGNFPCRQPCFPLAGVMVPNDSSFQWGPLRFTSFCLQDLDDRFELEIILTVQQDLQLPFFLCSSMLGMRVSSRS